MRTLLQRMTCPDAGVYLPVTLDGMGLLRRLRARRAERKQEREAIAKSLREMRTDDEARSMSDTVNDAFTNLGPKY
jgi:hypothetical protein